MHCRGWSSSGKKTPGDKERDPPQRQAYLRLRERSARRGKPFISIDESGFAPAVTRRFAYAPQGQRVSGLISGHRRPRPSLLAARSENTFAAPVLVAGTCTTPLFNAWLEQHLCPLLHDQPVVVMDNVPFHNSAKTKTLIHSTGAPLLFLPPYSPDLNPIEHDFATLKRLREYNEHQSLDTLIKTYKYQGA